MDGGYFAARGDEPPKPCSQRALQRADVDDQALGPMLGKLEQDSAGDLHWSRDDDQIVLQLRAGPIRDSRIRARRVARVRNLHREALRGEELAEPRAHLARAADDQRTFARAARLRGDACLL